MKSAVGLRIFQVLSGVVLGLAIIGAGYAAWVLTKSEVKQTRPAAEFSLVNSQGGTSQLSDLRGNVVLMFFGYTNWADVCPSTLFTMAQSRKLMGADADRFKGVFISVDPDRDTPRKLGKYVSYFDPDFLALTGSESQLREVAKLYGAHFEKEAPEADGSYLVAHTTFGYLIDTEGKVVKLFDVGAPPDDIARAAQALLRRS